MKIRKKPDECIRFAVDCFTWEDIRRFALDSVVEAQCSACKETCDVEPDAEGYDCQNCGEQGSVTSPLVKLGLI